MKKEKPTYSEVVQRMIGVHKTMEEHWGQVDFPEDPEEQLDIILQMSQGCQECFLSETRNHVTGPDGEVGAKIMLVLEGPGFLEDLSRVPLVGPQELQSSHCNLCKKVRTCYDNRITFQKYKRPTGIRRAITCEPDYAGKLQLPKKPRLYSSGGVFDGLLVQKYRGVFPRHNWTTYYKTLTGRDYPYVSPWFITNSVLCRAWDKEKLRDMSPTNLAIKTCRKWLVAQWAVVQPKVIIATGQSALIGLTGVQKSVETTRFGEIIDSPMGKIIYTPHIAHVMRERDKYRQGIGYAKTGKTLDIALTMAGLLDGEELKPIER